MFTERLHAALTASTNFDVRIVRHHKIFQFAPALFLLKRIPYSDVAIVNVEYAWPLKKSTAKLISVVHQCVWDSRYQKTTSFMQKLFHSLVLRPNTQRSITTSDEVVCCSSYLQSELSKHCTTRSSTVIHNGIDTSIFKPNSKRSHDKLRILFAGNLIPRKGIHVVAALAHRLSDIADFVVTSGKRDTAIPACIVESPIEILGTVSEADLIREYQHADLCIVPSRHEGFGYTAIEAMACGTPCIASDVCSLPEIITDGLSGRLCTVDDIDHFESVIRELHSDKSTLDELSKNARTTVLNSFPLSVQSDAYRLLCES